MAIRRANILGILNEMYEAEHKEHQQERDFAIKGVGLAIDARNKKELRRLEEKRLAITKADADVRARRTEQLIKLDDAKFKNEENQKIFNNLKNLASRNAAELTTMTQELATRLYDRVIAPSFEYNGEINFENKPNIQRFIERIGNEALAKDLIQFGMTRNAENGLFPEIETEALIYELFGDEANKDMLQNTFGFYGDNQFSINRMTKIQDDFFLFKAQNDEIAKELSEYQGLGDTQIGENLKNLLLYGSVEAPSTTDEDTIVDLGNNMIGTMMEPPEGVKSLLSPNEYEQVTQEEIQRLKQMNKDLPDEILKIKDAIGPKPISELELREYYDKVEKELNANSSAWTEYKDEHGNVDTNKSPWQNYRQLRFFKEDIAGEYNKSNRAFKQHTNKMQEKEILHNSGDPEFFYSDQERANDAKVAYLYQLQLDLLTYQNRIASERKDTLWDVMGGFSKFFQGEADGGGISYYGVGDITKETIATHDDNVSKRKKIY